MQAARTRALLPAGRRLLLPAAAFILYLAGRSPFLGQWDSFDYLKEAITHTLSALGFGRPIFVGALALLWEISRGFFHLSPLQFESVASVSVIAVGACGVLLFQRFSGRWLPFDGATEMAAIAFALSPSYALYSGYVMADVPMLVTALGAAALLWPEQESGRLRREASAGILFGLSAGMREQALTLFPAMLWITWMRRAEGRARLRSAAVFASCAALFTLAPILALYLHDAAAFSRRMSVWLSAIPMGQAQMWRNIQASLLFTLALCPAAWACAGVAAACACVRGGLRRLYVPMPWVAGILCCLVLPIAVLWRDADIQLHPRYALVALPAAVLVCAYAYRLWLPSRRAALVWAVLQVTVYGGAQAAVAPFRHSQAEGREYARLVRESLPGPGLLAGGTYSPVFDYYRATGIRPQWDILWSGWGWTARNAEEAVRKAWARRVPLYLCDGPLAWRSFEDERLDLHFLVRDHRQERVAPGIIRIDP